MAYWYRDNLTVSDGAADGAKWGAIQGNKLTPAGETADYTVISVMRQAMANLTPDSIDRIVIYKAGPSAFGTPLAQVPAQCKTSGTSITGSCNIYTPTVAFLQVQNGNAGYFNCATTPGSPACAWNPITRHDGPNATDIDYLGVYVKLKHKNLTGIFGASRNIEAASISRLEPGNLVP